MKDQSKSDTTRRDFLKTAGAAAAASVVPLSISDPPVHVAENNTLQIALIGCGGRGSGAVSNAIDADVGPVKLVAMADVFEDRLTTSYSALNEWYGEGNEFITVPEDQKFVGFDAYMKAMDCLEPGDIAILATPPAFRWVHFKYAVEKGLNVFMEKPVTVDGPTTRRMLGLASDASQKSLKVGVGLMVRHCRGRQALFERIQNGEIGEIVSMRGYRANAESKGFLGPNSTGLSDLLYQVKFFHGFLWASGGIFSDFNIHQIDELSWMKDAWPIEARGLGGRHYRGDSIDQNFDTYSVEYIYPDGARLHFAARSMAGCEQAFSSYVHGSIGCGIVSTRAHMPGRVRTYRGQNFSDAAQIWAFPQPEPDPYVMEWVDLLEAIREDKPYNEVKLGAESSLVTSMGRMAAHTGRVVTYDEILNSDHEFAPDVDKLTMDSPPPLALNEDGLYPIPQPGIVTHREY
jgi:predicted dehydrogenase